MWDLGVSSYGQHSECMRKGGTKRKREGGVERAREHRSIRKMQITDRGSWYPKFTTDCDCSLKNLVSGHLRLSTDSGMPTSLCARKDVLGRRICLTGIAWPHCQEGIASSEKQMSCCFFAVSWLALLRVGEKPGCEMLQDSGSREADGTSRGVARAKFPR